MNRACDFLCGVGLGVAAAYFFDPVVGNRRRALLRDQIVHFFNKSGDILDARSRDLRNRARGVASETRSAFTNDDVTDDVLVQRVRSEMGRHVSHPSAIEVSACDGKICLSGPILSNEVEELICAVRSVRGVQGIENHLDAHESAENIPALQGGATAN